MNENGCIMGLDFSEREITIMPSLDKLREINKTGSLIENNGITYLGTSFTSAAKDDPGEKIPITIKDVERSGHFGCIGTTRVGKTRLMENIIEQDIRKGYNVVIIQSFCDYGLLSKVYQVVAESGRLDDVMLFSVCIEITVSALTSFTNQSIGQGLVNDVIKRLEEKRGVILVCITSSIYRRPRKNSNMIGRVFISMIQGMLGYRELSVPLCLHIDDGLWFLYLDPEIINPFCFHPSHNILYPGIQQLFNKGGGADADVWVHFYTPMLEGMIETGVKTIIDNINTWIFMLVNHPNAVKFVEMTAPVKKNYQRPSGGKITARVIAESYIRADQVLQLPSRHFYMRSYRKIYRGITNDVSQRYVTVTFPNLS